MFERMVISLLFISSLALVWFGWQLYKAKLVRSIQPVEASGDNRPTLLYFTGAYCTACKFHQTPIVETITHRFGEKIAVKKYDVAKYPELASRYKVLTLPTTVIIDQTGQVAHVNYGVTRRAKLEMQLS